MYWTFHGSGYCQLIQDMNKQKQLAWAHAFPLHLRTASNQILCLDNYLGAWSEHWGIISAGILFPDIPCVLHTCVLHTLLSY